jgi:hypothetical protein
MKDHNEAEHGEGEGAQAGALGALKGLRQAFIGPVRGDAAGV